MPQQSDLAFLEPNDKPFRYLEAYCVGRTISNRIAVWTLDARTSNLTLSNNLGFKIQIGQVSKVVVRCSLAFLEHTKPYMVLEYSDETRAIFTIDLTDEQPVLASLKTDLVGYRDITLTYWRSMYKDKLIVNAVGGDGIYSGFLDGEGNLEMELFNRVEVNEPRRALYRVGVNTANQLQTEIVDIVINQ